MSNGTRQKIIGKSRDQWTETALKQLKEKFSPGRAIFLQTPSAQIFLTVPAKILFYKIYWVANTAALKKMTGWLLKLMSFFAKIIIAGTQASESNYLKLGIKNNKIKLLYPFSEKMGAPSRPSRELIIGCDAAFTLDNGLGVLLKSAALAQDILGNLKLIIGGMTREKTKIEWVARNLGINKLLQTVPTPETDWVSRIDIYFLPAVEKNLPLSLRAALCFGKSLIAIDSQAAREFIVANKNGVLLRQEGSEMLGQAIINLGRDPAWRQAMGKNNLALAARIFAREKFDEIAEKIFG